MYPAVLRLDQVPQALRAFRQWVLWRWEQRDGKQVKVPYTFMGYRASTTNPDTWSRIDFLLQILGKNPRFAAGVGFVVTAGDPFVGIDLDDCINGSGCVKVWAEALLKQFDDTYIEVTPSGAGLRIWCTATTARAMKKSLPDGGIEIYSTARYFTFTGDRFNDATLEITDHQADIDQLFTAYAPITYTACD